MLVNLCNAKFSLVSADWYILIRDLFNTGYVIFIILMWI